MTEKMRQMIDRFYLGELTIDEERRLIGLLLSDDCPMDLRVERHALIMLARQEAIDMPGDLEKRVVGAIKSHTLKIYWWLSAVAAFLLIIGMGYWGFLHKEIQQSPSISASENHGDKNHGDRSMILYGIKRPVPMILKTLGYNVRARRSHARLYGKCRYNYSSCTHRAGTAPSR